MGIKNIWSLNIDELLVADKLKRVFKKKDHEVFFPLNSQLKDIDLILINLKKGKSINFQVKGSRTYKPQKSETAKFGKGSAAWFTLKEKSIFKPTNKMDYYVFVLHSLIDGESKKEIKINYLIIPEKEFKKKVLKKIKRKGDKYHFFIWIDVDGKRSFDFNNRNKIIHLSKYLDNWNVIK